ncbi:hypothetical protein H6G80_28130 [Nostoc sp. FACHB-87]|uniref:hypothetical protein n=1 Tax=Nostocaceae TaxID=1162 RepID=UPI001683415A|nr:MULTISPECIES: hypothetical protein [Nostocaceae]MBD2457922.1 hypothetical protein [Nostoc sp. FACHB-87]MBD2479836.1 hypothetical protein [Anabaena sp. FACHB-83]
MNKNELSDLIQIYVEEIGLDHLKETLTREINKNKSDDYSLTIIANQSLHEIPSRFVHGELYIASYGNLKFENGEIIIKQYEEILLKVRQKLSEKEWKKVYLVPTGHSTLALQIKSLVYHVLRIDTVDLFYSKGEYYEIDINVRTLLL